MRDADLRKGTLCPFCVPIHKKKKKKICKRACGEEITSVDISGVRVSAFGKAKKAIKVECPNIASKLHLMRRARERRPQGFYISEFLTESKLKLFHSVRALKKITSTKNKSCFYKGRKRFLFTSWFR